mmetsp:Transcript_72736/g.168574  ORF Transcript_72736/g.168574 Transcript_72736/m.168574 type:complete len:175 (-) Transcript_72736:120-644(-)
MAKVKTCLWFNGNAQEAVGLYTSLIPDSRITSTQKIDGDESTVTVMQFSLAGSPFEAMNYPRKSEFTEATSIQVMTEDQEETDRLWSALVADGGSESKCGWLKDKFGVSWQIVPKALPRFIDGPDAEGAERARAALMGMAKIEIAQLEAAYKGEAASQKRQRPPSEDVVEATGM